MTPAYFTQKLKSNYRWLYDIYYEKYTITSSDISSNRLSDLISGNRSLGGLSPYIISDGISILGYIVPSWIAHEGVRRINEDQYDFLYRYIIDNEDQIIFKFL